MNDTFKDELAAKYNKAVEDFEKAKREAIADLEKMTAFQGLDYGAAYFTKIDKVTSAAARVCELGQVIRAFQYYNPEMGEVIPSEA